MMKLTTVLLIATMMQVSAGGFAQKLTLNQNKATVKQIFKEIKKQTGYDVFYLPEILNDKKTIPATFSNTPLDQVMKKCLEGEPLVFTILEKSIVIKQKEKPPIDQSEKQLKAIDIKGHVVDAQGKPLPGASVNIKGTTKVVITDKNGDFAISGVPENAVLVISFIGFESREVDAKQNLGNIALMASLSKLDEVQVIAYGTTTQRLSTSNISVITSEEIARQPVGNPLLALQGKLAGVYITQASGLPGSGVKVRVQGQNSLNFGNDPLYVIDGIPYLSQMLSTVNGGPVGSSGGAVVDGIPPGNGNPLTYVNPDDIQTITVLRDADATAIYGSRAANGAILITTKKGQKGDTKVDANFQSGTGEVSHRMKLLNAAQYLEMRREAIKNDNASVSSTAYDLNGLWDQSRSTDWQKELIGGTANYTNLNASISGGNDNTQYIFGTTFNRQTTVFPGNFSDKKGGAHLNINSNSSNGKLGLQISANYLYDQNKLPQTDLTQQALQLSPVAPALYNLDGSLNWMPNAAGNSTWTNPLANYLNDYKSLTSNLITSSVISYRPISNIELKIQAGYNRLDVDETMLLPFSAMRPERRSNGVRGSLLNESLSTSWIIEPQIIYRKNINRGKLELLLGGTLQESSNKGESFYASGFNSDFVMSDIKSASNITVNSSLNSTYRYNAFFGRINYNLDDKYIINLTARRDGSSRFGAENQFQNFGAVGLAWIFSKETMLKDYDFLSFGKLRGSFGTSGSDQIGDYQFLNLYNAYGVDIPYQGVTSLQPNKLPNPYLQWEEVKKLQVGLDLGFFNDKANLSINYVRNRSSNQLLQYTLPISVGFGSIIQNFPAKIQNREWEFQASVTPIKGKFNWNAAFNVTLPKNKLISFPSLSTSTYSNSLIVGQSINIQRIYHFIGVDPSNGQYLFADHNGKPTTTPNSQTDRTETINLTPTIYGGFENSFKFKGFQLDILLQFVKQQATTPNFGFGIVAPGGFGFNSSNNLANQPISVLNRWKKPGDVTDIQRYNSNSSLLNPLFNVMSSDAGFSDASFIRFKNISLSWQIPQNYLKRLSVKRMSLFLHGQNLMTLTKYEGMDPESQGFGTLPPLRIMTLGTHITL